MLNQDLAASIQKMNEAAAANIKLTALPVPSPLRENHVGMHEVTITGVQTIDYEKQGEKRRLFIAKVNHAAIGAFQATMTPEQLLALNNTAGTQPQTAGRVEVYIREDNNKVTARIA